ncbi:MAG: phosphate ABC transporter permease PtsA [Nitrososphaeraceae archaeon]|nr:phosphate ABC transporter permease PtsA [Nitrososphaeraceae archaeon]
MNSEKNNPKNNENKQYTDKINNYIKKKYKRRIITNKLVTILTIISVVVAVIPLGSILIEVIKNGSEAISIEFLTQKPGALGSGKGGIGPAIQGTLIIIGLSSALSVPVGMLTGIYLSEYSKNNRFSTVVRFVNDVLTGLPSIVIGIVGYVTLVLTLGSYSVLAGAFSLSIIMIPIIVRVTEETLKLVPNSLREAGYSLGLSKTKITLNIVLSTAKSGVLTGIVLAISRIAGETAPLIMTILGTSLFFSSFTGPVDALPLRIWRLASQPYESAHSFGWGAALILIVIVLFLGVGLRVLIRKNLAKVEM